VYDVAANLEKAVKEFENDVQLFKQTVADIDRKE